MLRKVNCLGLAVLKRRNELRGSNGTTIGPPWCLRKPRPYVLTTSTAIVGHSPAAAAIAASSLCAVSLPLLRACVRVLFSLSACFDLWSGVKCGLSGWPVGLEPCERMIDCSSLGKLDTYTYVSGDCHHILLSFR
eukprot:COSAG06_NODE_532_length_14551_cov_16.536466_1_plen_135_part_00